MDEKEKQEFKDRILTEIRSACAKTITRLLESEHYEGAADIRDARNDLEHAVSNAIDGVPPF